MKKLLLIGALAATLWMPSAHAKTISISFDGLCDGLDIRVDTLNRTALETGNGCDEGAHFGAGTIGKIKNRGNAITFGVNLSGKGDTKDQYIYVVDYPLATGGAWSNFYTSDGKTMSRINSGTYTVTKGGTPKHGLGNSRMPR
jgi:hypothetical protein